MVITERQLDLTTIQSLFQKLLDTQKEEIEKGLWPAVEEFLENNTNWKLYKKFTHNNGLTILKKDEHY